MFMVALADSQNRKQLSEIVSALVQDMLCHDCLLHEDHPCSRFHGCHCYSWSPPQVICRSSAGNTVGLWLQTAASDRCTSNPSTPHPRTASYYHFLEGYKPRPSSYPLSGPKYLALGTIYPKLRVLGGSWSIEDSMSYDCLQGPGAFPTPVP